DAGKPDAADPIERFSSRPDATILCYATILFVETRMNDPERREQALGKDAPAEVANWFDPVQNVKADTPPCFIWQTVEDTRALPENAMAFATALRKAGHLFSLHLYVRGTHGIGIGVKSFSPEAQL